MEKIIILLITFALCYFADPFPDKGLKCNDIMRFSNETMNQYIAHSEIISDIKKLFEEFEKNSDMKDTIWINENCFKFKCSREKLLILKESNILESLTFDLNLLVGYEMLIIHNQYK